MWFIVFLICFGESLLCNAQHEVDIGPQVATEADQPNQGVNWDNIMHPITLSIRDGRTDAPYKPQDEVPGDDQQLIYSNEWQPFILPVNFNHYGDRSILQSGSEYSEDPRFLPTFLRRPDLDANNSVATNNAERDAVMPTPVPFSPFVIYPNPFNLYPNVNSEGSNIRVLQNSSTSTPIFLPDSVAANAEENQNEILPSENIALTPDYPRGFYPLNFYRQLQGFNTPRVRVYRPPYPVLPFPREDSLRPIITPNFNEESRAEVEESVSPGAEDSGVRRPTMSEYVSGETMVGEALPNNILSPPLRLPFPVAAYPFRVVSPPSPFVPPLISNALPGSQTFSPSGSVNNEQPLFGSTVPRSITFNPTPFLRFTNVRTENPTGDSILSPPPVLTPVGAIPPLEPADGALQPGLELPINVDVDGENSFQGSDPNVLKIPYEFGFDMNDGLGTDQHRKEVSDGSGVVTGSYGYRDLFGVYRLVNYIADKDGFRAIVKSNEPGVASSSSANVVVLAEPPPPHAIAQGITASEPEVVIAAAAADEVPELVAEAIETEDN